MKKTLFVLSLFCSIHAISQNIDSTISKYATSFPQERTYIHYDKSSYGPGETIWFKAYLLEGISPAFESKNLYLDWTDESGNLLSHTVSPLQGATTSGQFDIPTTYKGNFIHVKAYTKWMLNFDSSFLYEKDIRIITDISKPVFNHTPAVPSLSFFPEGGDAVSGVNNKIAFKANDQWGRPVKIKGVIVNNSGEKIDSLKVIHDGMGYFFLFPKSGEKYTAKWKDEKGKEYTTALPEIRTAGVSLQIVVSDSRRNFFISAEKSLAEKMGTIHLIGTMHQHQVFKVTKDFKTGEAKGVIPVGNLPSGILVITVFDNNWKPIAERITYVNNDEYRFTAEMNVLHWGLNKRARNEIEIAVPDSLYANFSVAVTDFAIDTDSSNNIISNLLLTSDLKGQVFNPSYYFSANNNTIAQHLDLVMLTHGWRRFKWDDVVKGTLPKISFPKDTSYLSLSGKLYGASPTELRANPFIILLISQKSKEGNQVLTIPINPDGTFVEPDAIVFDTAKIYYQLSKGVKGASVRFMENLLPPYRHRLTANGFFYNQSGDTSGLARHFYFSDEVKRILQETEGKLLENVLIKAKTKSPVQLLDEKYTSGLFIGDGQQFDLVNDKFAATAPNIFSYLQGKVAGLVISNPSQSPSITWRGSNVALFLDEVQIDADFISSISVNNIAYVKVFRPPFFGAPGGGSGGAIAIYTRKGNDIKFEPGQGLDNNTVSGYSMIRQFYSPNYSSFVAANEKADLRTTLYWNPQVITTPEKNKVKLTFYNNDITKAFRVIIEGMTLDGQLTRIEQIME